MKIFNQAIAVVKNFISKFQSNKISVPSPKVDVENVEEAGNESGTMSCELKVETGQSNNRSMESEPALETELKVDAESYVVPQVPKIFTPPPPRRPTPLKSLLKPIKVTIVNTSTNERTFIGTLETRKHFRPLKLTSTPFETEQEGRNYFHAKLRTVFPKGYFHYKAQVLESKKYGWERFYIKKNTIKEALLSIDTIGSIGNCHEKGQRFVFEDLYKYYKNAKRVQMKMCEKNGLRSKELCDNYMLMKANFLLMKSPRYVNEFCFEE